MSASRPEQVQSVGNIGQIFIRRSSGLTRQVSAIDAMFFCALAPGYLWSFIFITWVPWLYPGASLPLIAFGVLEVFPIAALYWLFSVSMPRSGGEYIYLSRTIHPAVGLVCSFIITYTLLNWVGLLTDWMMKFGIIDFPRAIGLMYNDPNWLNFTNILAGEWSRTVIATVAMLFLCYLLLKGSRWVMRLAYIAAASAGLALVAFAYAVLTGSGDFAANWTAMTGVDFNSIIPIATSPEVGLTLGFSAIATIMGAAVYTGANTAGSTLSANIAGEIRGVQRSQLIALFGSLLICLVVWFCVYSLAYMIAGADWISSLSALFMTGNAAYPLGNTEAFPTLLAVYLTKSPLVVFLMSLGFTITAFGTVATLAFAASRNIFAWAFDRMIPVKFAEIDRHFRAPYLVIALVGFSGWIMAMIDIWAPQFNGYATSSTISWFAGWILLGVAGMIFAYRKKSLFDASPPLVRSRWLGVPVIFWMGLLTVIVCGFIEYSTIYPLFAGKFEPVVFYLIIFMVVFPLIIYFASSSYYKGKGIAVAKQFEEVPPE